MPHHGAGAEFLRFGVGLHGQFASGRENQGGRFLFVRVGGRQRVGLENAGDDGQEKSGGLATARLRACHQVASVVDDRNSVFLDRRRLFVARLGHVLQRLLEET